MPDSGRNPDDDSGQQYCVGADSDPKAAVTGAF